MFRHAFAENAIGRGLHKESFVASCSVVSRRSWAKEQANQASLINLAASLGRLTLLHLVEAYFLAPHLHRGTPCGCRKCYLRL